MALTFGKYVSDKELITILEKVRLLKWFHNGLDTKLDEHGVILSGGEKQRLTLGRLWLSEA